MFSVITGGSPPEGDAPEAQPLGRGGASVEGRSPVGECRPEGLFIHLSKTDRHEGGNHPSNHPPQEGFGPDVDRHDPALPTDPDR